MKTLFALLLLIPNLSWGEKNKDFVYGAQFLTECRVIVDAWNKYRHNENTKNMMIFQYSHLLIGYVSGFNGLASKTNNYSGVEIFQDSGNPEFLFQYIINYCNQNKEDLLWNVFHNYVTEKINLGKTIK